MRGRGLVTPSYSIGKNGRTATIDKNVAKNLQKGLAVIAKRLGGTYNHAAGRYDFKDEAALEKFTDAANSLLKILDPATAAKYSITAWHGSPHNFERFSLTAIGTGEGAQVHGWGLYFAKERSVSEGYRERLAVQIIEINGRQYYNPSSFDKSLSMAEQFALEALQEKGFKNKEAAITKLNERLEETPASRKKTIEDAIDFIKQDKIKVVSEISGSLFQVEIPDEDVMLDEQKRLDEQPPKVQAALREIGGKVVEHDAIKINGVYYEWHDGRNAGWYESDTQKIVSMDTARDIAAFLNKTPTKKQKWETHKVEHNDFEGLIGKNIYNELVKKTGSPRKASELLNKHGIKGITYMGGTDGRCYVVFDDQAIEITAKYSAAAEEAQKLLKSIKIVDDADLTKAQSRFVELGNEMGTTIVWYDGDSRLNGVQEGNVILLNRKAAADLTKTFWHETFHWIKANNQALAAEVVKAVQDAGIITEKQIEAYRKLTSRRDLLTDEAVIEEMLADEFINPAKAHDLMNRLAKADAKNIPLVQRIMAYLKKLADRFVEFMQGSRVKPGAKFSEADNALPINERVLTTKQRDAFIAAVGKLAASITDSKGRKIFKTTDHGKGITLADGRALPNVGVGETRFSAIQGDREEIKALRKKYEGTDKWLKAPNGEKTNLTEEQWLNVRTKAFKDWFGDWENDPANASNAVDENGEPLVVYHGSNRRFNTFKKGDLGFHVGTQEQAEVAAEGQVDWTGTGKARIIPVFANIRNPIRIDYDPETWNDMGSNFMHQLRREGIITKKEFSKLNYDGLSYARMRPIRERLQAAGYDGVVYPNWYEFRPGSERRTTFDNSFIALSPNQIKSATDNIGTYSTEDDDIRFSANLNGNVASKATTNRKFSIRGRGTAQGVELYEVTGDEDVETWEPSDDVSYRFYTTGTPMSRAGYAMFADDPESNNHYGAQAYIVRHDDLTPVEEVQEKVWEYLRNLKKREDETDRIVSDDVVDEYFRDDDYEIDFDKAEDIIEELAPEDIVNSAEVFDNEDLVQWLYENILEPNDIAGIKTPDGALVFDETIIEPDFEASVYYAQLGDKILPPIANKNFPFAAKKLLTRKPITRIILPTRYSSEPNSPNIYASSMTA